MHEENNNLKKDLYTITQQAAVMLPRITLPVSLLLLYTSNLYLQSVRMEDGGRYHCAEGDHRSSAVTLNVGYPPKNVSVSVSPSDEIMEGSSVTLTCSSDAKPAAWYHWFKGKDHKATGETFIIHKIRSDDGGEYKCWARNEHGYQLSTAVNIDVYYPPRNVSVSVSPSGETDCMAVGVGVGLCLVAAAFVGFFCWRRKMQMRQKDERDQKDADADAETYAALDPSSRSSNDEYGTLTTAHSSPPDDTYATLDPHTISPEYETLTDGEKPELMVDVHT